MTSFQETEKEVELRMKLIRRGWTWHENHKLFTNAMLPDRVYTQKEALEVEGLAQ
jgi:hypothetical protein